MIGEADIRTAFPELDEIRDETLAEQVIDVWVAGLRQCAYDDVAELPWWPPRQDVLDDSITLVEHVRDVTRCAVGLIDVVTASPGVDVDRDVAVAGALLHDVSKLYEIDRDGMTPLYELLSHPHYAVHVLAEAGCSLHLQHIALSHSGSSAVEPKTLEAVIVRFADQFVVEGIYHERTGLLSDGSSPGVDAHR